MKKIWFDVSVPHGCNRISSQRRRFLLHNITKVFTHNCKTHKHPEVFFTDGLPASGKSTLIKKFVKKGYAFANPDDTAMTIPEYANGLALIDILGKKHKNIGSSRVRDECIDLGFDIYKEIINKSLKKKYNIIIDAPGSSVEEISKFIRKGYKITVLYVIGDPKISSKRAIARALKNGQFIRPTIQGLVNMFKKGEFNDIMEKLPLVLQYADRVIICDNRGRKPKCKIYKNSPTEFRRIYKQWEKRMHGMGAAPP